MNELEKKLTFFARESFLFSLLSLSLRVIVRIELDIIFIRPGIFLLDFSWISKDIRFRTNWLINSIIEYRV